MRDAAVDSTGPPVVLSVFHSTQPMDSVAILPQQPEAVNMTSSPLSSSPAAIDMLSTASMSAVRSPCRTKSKKIRPLEHDEDEEEKEKRVHQRMSTGSIVSQQQQHQQGQGPSQADLEHRRHTFCALSQGRAISRRHSQDFLDFGSLSVPPANNSVVPPRSKSHLQHLRVYGKMTGEVKQVSEEHIEGKRMLDVVCPSRRTIWIRGRPICIEWRVEDEDVKTVKIELLEEGSSATTVIAHEAANIGHFTYSKVPWGMDCGNKYFLRISCTLDPSRFMTTSFFQIGSAP